MQFDIVTIFVSIFLVLTIGTGWYTYERNREAVLNMADQMIAGASQAVIDRTIAYLEPLQVQARLAAGVAGRSGAVETSPLLAGYLLDSLESYPDLYSLYIGYADGGFVQAINLPEGMTRFGPNSTPLVEGTRHVLRQLSRRGGLPAESWTYVDEQGLITAIEHAPEVTYDPRARPWYQGAGEAGSAYWTDLYVFASLRKPGITAAFPAMEAPGGRARLVAGADMDLEALSTFLMEQAISSNSSAVILDITGSVVAHPDPTEAVREGNDGKLRPASSGELSDPVLIAALDAFGNGRSGERSVTLGGEDYVARLTPFPDSFGRDWSILVTAPLDDFIGEVKETQRNTLIISLVTLLAGLALIVLVGRWIAKPIRILSDEAARITDFNLEGEIKVRSHIREVQDLADSMDTMKRAMRAFGKYTPKGLVRRLLASGADMELGGKQQELTILFTDIEGFTTIAEKMQPAELMRHMSVYLDECTRLIRGHGGAIDKFIGDAIMAFWNAPDPDPDHAVNACRLAVELRLKVIEMNERFEAEGKPALNTRLGLHMGEVIVGNLGSSERMNYTAIGDTVNVAARLESLNKLYGTKACVSESVHAAVGDKFLFRPLDFVVVKGRAAPMMVYQLLAANDEAYGPMTASDRGRDLAKRTEEAFLAYRQRRFADAILMFKAILTRFPDDRLPEVYIERCQAYLDSPPPANWQGVYHARSK